MSSNSIKRQNPYVGPPAFKYGQTLYGRDREIAELLDLLIVERIVTMYSPSGAGKSSLINAALIPALENERFNVLPVIRVGKEFRSYNSNSQHVNRYVFSTLASLAKKDDSDKQISKSELSLMTLPDYFNTLRNEINTHTGKVLIFDQFEEILTADPTDQKEKLEFFKQIGYVLRNHEYWVLFSMREEHFAGLQPYLHLVPTGLSTRYRLELLGPTEATKAIRKPAEDAGVNFKKEAAKQLVDDLRSVKVRTTDGTTEDRIGPHVEPLQLQVVCESLWDELPPSTDEITTADLNELGDVNQALTQYYEQAIKATCEATMVKIDNLRRWFDEYLITPGDTRGMAYRDKEHTGRGGRGIPNTAVDKLEKQHIIRAEIRAGGERWYELTHDRFIGPVNEANEHWRAKERTRKMRLRLFKGIGLVTLIILAIFSYEIYDSNSEFEDRVNRPLNDLRARFDITNISAFGEPSEYIPAQDHSKVKIELDRVVSYLLQELSLADKVSRLIFLFPNGNIGNLDLLSQKLKGVEGLISTSYYTDPWAANVMPLVADSEEWPITVKFNSRRNLDHQIIQYHWRTLISNLAETWGIPAPTSLKFVLDEHLPVDEIKIITKDAHEYRNQSARTEVSVTVPSFPGFILVSEVEMPERLIPWFQRNKKTWQQVATLKHNGPWWLVPKWTVPIFKEVGHSILPREAAVAIAVANRMLDQPDLVLNRQNVAYLLNKLKNSDYSFTVDEALFARGGIDGIVQDLREVIRQDSTLNRLSYLLDTLTTFPVQEYSSNEAAWRSIEEQTYSRAPALTRILGVRNAAKLRLTDYELKLKDELPYRDSITELDIEPPIRVYLGDELINEFVTNDKLRPDILELLADLRGEIYKRFGILPPPVYFRVAENELMPNELRIEILNENSNSPGAKPILIQDIETTQKTLLEELRWRYLLLRGWWLDTEYVNRMLQILPEKFKDWLIKQYSLTDIKSLLRLVIATRDEELYANDISGRHVALDTAYPGRSLREFPWLMTSLPFWVLISGPYDAVALAENLETLQKHRMSTTQFVPSKDRIVTIINKGIVALDKQSYASAEQHFKEAIAIDNNKAIVAFLQLYTQTPQVTFNGQLKKLKSECKSKAPGNLNEKRDVPIDVRYTVEDFLLRYAKQINPTDRREFELCLLEHYMVNRYEQHAHDYVQRILTGGANLKLSANEKYTLAYWMFELNGETVLEPDNFPKIENFLMNAFKEWTVDDVAVAEAAYYELLGRYKSSRSPHWYWRLLVNIAQLRQHSYWIPLYLGMSLSGGRSVEDGQNAVTWLNKAEKRLPHSREPKKDWQRLRAWQQSYIAIAYLTQAEQGQRQNRTKKVNEAIRLLLEQIDQLRSSGSIGNERWPGKELYHSLISAYQLLNRIQDARIALDEALVIFESPEFQEEKFILLLASNEISEAIQLALSAVGEDKIESKHTQFWVALSQLLTDHKGSVYAARRFIATDHNYVDYTRMMLYWSLKKNDKDEQAQALLDERWSEINPTKWEKRLESGDTRVWREMLIGYYLGKVEQKSIFDPIQNRSTFEASPISRLGVEGLSYDGMRCEAYFYDALLQSVSGEPATQKHRFKQSLQNSLDAGNAQLYEYLMAKYLLNQDS